MAKHKGGMGRNKEFCKRYKAEGRREKNRRARFIRTMKAQPFNEQTLESFEKEFPKDAEIFRLELEEMKKESVAEAG